VANLPALKDQLAQEAPDWKQLGDNLLYATDDAHLSRINSLAQLTWAHPPIPLFPNELQTLIWADTHRVIINHSPSDLAAFGDHWSAHLDLLTPLFIANESELTTDWDSVTRSVALFGSLTLLLAAVVFAREVYTRGIRLWPKSPIGFQVHSPFLLTHPKSF